MLSSEYTYRPLFIARARPFSEVVSHGLDGDDDDAIATMDQQTVMLRSYALPVRPAWPSIISLDTDGKEEVSGLMCVCEMHYLQIVLMFKFAFLF